MRRQITTALDWKDFAGEAANLCYQSSPFILDSDFALDWSPQQDAALKAVAKWLKTREPQVFRLFGYAGTGKTTLATHIAGDYKGEVAFGAFTGKAALVMRSKGCTDARTIHSMIYTTRESDSEEPEFVLNEEAAAAKADLIIIDECSMVDADLGRDLLTFGKKVLVLGDPAQLPPVSGGGFFTEAEPDIMLTEVHRQAADNPIIRLSMMVREGENLEFGTYGDSRILRKADINTEMVTEADQVLVGMNKTRRAYNKRLRALLGYTEVMPMVNDKLVCLKNDRKKGLLNGGLWRVKALRPTKSRVVSLRVSPEDTGGKVVCVSCLPEFFEGTEEAIPYAKRRDYQEFDYGYALTVHKAQGSQWDKLVLFDESFAFREHRNRWLYTGITRAAESLTLVV